MYLFAEDVVELLAGLGGEANEELVEGPRPVDQLGVEECRRQRDLEI